MYETFENSVHFLDLNVSLKGGAIFTDLQIKPTDGYQFLHINHHILAIQRILYPIARLEELADSVHH